MVKNLPAVQETQDTRVQSLGREVPLEKEMTTHSSTLAWKIPWTEEPGRLYSMGSKESEMTEQLSLFERGGFISVFMSLFCYFVPKLPICFYV